MKKHDIPQQRAVRKLADESLEPSPDASLSKRERVIRKSYALLQRDLDNIESIKDRCLNQKVVLNDSHVIRLALELAVKLHEDALIKASTKIIKIPPGRPKGS